VTAPPDKGVTLDSILESAEFKHPGAVRGRRLNNASIMGRRLGDRVKRQDYDKSVPITQCLEVRRTNTDKSNCPTTVDKHNVLTPLPPGRYPDAFNNSLPFRYYTVTEYERLQTLPDGYTAGVSEGKAKKAIGNAWTVDVIAWILSHIPREGDDEWMH
jgi:site-specific DNA-cytosine methylase